MPHSHSATVHGLCLLAIGGLLIVSPSKAASLIIAAASQVGTKVAASNLAVFTSPLIGALLCAYGISHLHISVISPKASAVMLCTEGVLLSALCVSFLLNSAIVATDPLFVAFSAFTLFFTLWATYEYFNTTSKQKIVKKAA
jgi:hypothetical protein